MFVSKQNEDSLKLINFRKVDSCKSNLLKTPVATPSYIAPELLRKELYGVESDMWSAGVLLYIMLSQSPPFYDNDDNLGNLFNKIKEANFEFPSNEWQNISHDCKDLITKLLNPDVKERLTAKQVLQHKWIVNYESIQNQN